MKELRRKFPKFPWWFERNPFHGRVFSERSKWALHKAWRKTAIRNVRKFFSLEKPGGVFHEFHHSHLILKCSRTEDRRDARPLRLRIGWQGDAMGWICWRDRNFCCIRGWIFSVPGSLGWLMGWNMLKPPRKWAIHEPCGCWMTHCG